MMKRKIPGGKKSLIKAFQKAKYLFYDTNKTIDSCQGKDGLKMAGGLSFHPLFPQGIR